MPPPLRTGVCEETESSQLKSLGERFGQLGIALPGRLRTENTESSGGWSEANSNEVSQAAVPCEHMQLALSEPQFPYRRPITFV